MIAFISGIVASYTSTSVVVDRDGMGWEIAYPHTSSLSLNQKVRIYTYLHITDNDMSLFGFESEAEKELFIRLISVKGLGPKTAMSMLTSAGYQNIVSAIEKGDVSALKKMPGIGARSASQIVLDLKGKLVTTEAAAKSQPSEQYPVEIRDALEGLKNLGYKGNELSSAAAYMNQKPGLTTEAYLKMGLQYLLKQKIGG